MIPLAPVRGDTGMVQSVEGNGAERGNVNGGVESIGNSSDGTDNIELILLKELDAYLNGKSPVEEGQEVCATTGNGGNVHLKRKRLNEESEEVLKVMSRLVQDLYESIMLIKKLEMERKKNLGLEDHFKEVINSQREKFRDDIRKNLKSILMGYDQMLRKSANTRDVALKISRMTRLAVEDVECVISGCIQLEDRSQYQKNRSVPGKFFLECSAGEFCVDYSKSLETIQRRKSVPHSWHKDNLAAPKGGSSLLREVLCNNRQLLGPPFGPEGAALPPSSSLLPTPNPPTFFQVPKTTTNPVGVGLSPPPYSRPYLPSASHPSNALNLPPQPRNPNGSVTSHLRSFVAARQSAIPINHNAYPNTSNLVSNYSYHQSLPAACTRDNATAPAVNYTPSGTTSHGNYYSGPSAHSGQPYGNHFRNERPSHRLPQELGHYASTGPLIPFPKPAHVSIHPHQHPRNPTYHNTRQSSLPTLPSHPSQPSLHPVPAYGSDLPLSAYDSSTGTVPHVPPASGQDRLDSVQSLFSHIPRRPSVHPSQVPPTNAPSAPTSNYCPSPLPPPPPVPVTASLPLQASSVTVNRDEPSFFPTVPPPLDPEPTYLPDPTDPHKLTYKNSRLEAGETFEKTPEPRPDPELIDLVDEVIIKKEEEEDDEDVLIIEGEEEEPEDDPEDLNVPRVRMCAQAECTNIGIRICKACCSVIYCSDTCQLKHWRTKHKEECYKLKELRGEVF